MAKEHKIEVLKSDKERVQMRPTIYIPSLDERGALHCIYEIVDNSLDELNAKDPVGDTVIVKFDDKTKECEVIDDGGGIPQKDMLDSLTKLNSSGKFHNDDDSHFVMSTGINGCGSCLNTYLSEYAIVTSTQKGKSLTYEFKKGDLVGTRETKAKPKDHGTAWKFKLDKKFLDINNVTAKMVKTRLKEKSYVNPRLKMEFVELKNGEVVKTSMYAGKDIQDRFNDFKADTHSLRVTGEKVVTVLERVSDDKLTDKKVVYDFVIGFKEAVLDCDNPEEEYIVSYANGATTYRHGAHLDGVRDGLVKFFRDRLNNKRKETDPVIMPSDCHAALCAVITASVQNPVFRGQFKDSITNQEVKFAVRDALVEALETANHSLIKEFEDFIKRVARGRAASKKIRHKDVANSFSKDRLKKYFKINRTDKTHDPELILVEGDSAAGNAVGVRDPYNQAVFSIQKPKNLYDLKSDFTNSLKTTFNSILDICKIQAGSKCDPSKSTMRRILCLTDGDVDGDSIAISAICLLAKHCKPLVDAGMVGRILPPAYQLQGKRKKPIFVHTQREFFEEITKYFVKDVKVAYKGKQMSEKELNAFVLKNFNYVKKLKKLADRYNCDYKLMERIAWLYHGKPNEQKQSYWSKALKMYPDISIIKEKSDDEEGFHFVITGTIKTKDMSTGGYDFVDVPFDDYWQKRVMSFKDYQSRNSDIYNYSINGNDGKSIWDIMSLFEDYIPDDVTRYKGLGELDSADLLKLCMDRDKREVYIFKFKDLEADLHKIDIIMSTKKEFLEARAKVLMNESIDDLDLDT